MFSMYVVAYFMPITNQAVVSNSSINVFSKSNGIIDQILVRNGQYVASGESVLIIKNKTLYNNYDIVKQQLDGTIQILETVKLRIATLNSNLSLANSQLSNFQEELSSDKNKEYDFEINKQIRIQQNIIKELQKQLAISSTESVKIQTQIIEYRSQLNIINDNLNDLTIRANNSGYIQNLEILRGDEVINNQKLFTIVSSENQKIIAYFSENDLEKIHENDEVLIFPRSYLGLFSENGRIVSGNWNIPINATESANHNYLINSPKRIPVEIVITSIPNAKYPLISGMSAYVYVVGK